MSAQCEQFSFQKQCQCVLIYGVNMFYCWECHKQNSCHLYCFGFEEEIFYGNNPLISTVVLQHKLDIHNFHLSYLSLYLLMDHCGATGRSIPHTHTAQTHSDWVCICAPLMPQTLNSYALNWYSSYTEMTMKRQVIFYYFLLTSQACTANHGR